MSGSGERKAKKKIYIYIYKIKTAFNSVPWDSENECHCYAEYVLVLSFRGTEGLIELDWNVTTRTMFSYLEYRIICAEYETGMLVPTPICTPAEHHPPIIDRRDLDSLSFPIGDDCSRFLSHYLCSIPGKVLARTLYSYSYYYCTSNLCCLKKSFCNGSIQLAGNG